MSLAENEDFSNVNKKSKMQSIKDEAANLLDLKSCLFYDFKNMMTPLDKNDGYGLFVEASKAGSLSEPPKALAKNQKTSKSLTKADIPFDDLLYHLSEDFKNVMNFSPSIVDSTAFLGKLKEVVPKPPKYLPPFRIFSSSESYSSSNRESDKSYDSNDDSDKSNDSSNDSVHSIVSAEKNMKALISINSIMFEGQNFLRTLAAHGDNIRMTKNLLDLFDTMLSSIYQLIDLKKKKRLDEEYSAECLNVNSFTQVQNNYNCLVCNKKIGDSAEMIAVHIASDHEIMLVPLEKKSKKHSKVEKQVNEEKELKKKAKKERRSARKAARREAKHLAKTKEELKNDNSSSSNNEPKSSSKGSVSSRRESESSTVSQKQKESIKPSKMKKQDNSSEGKEKQEPSLENQQIAQQSLYPNLQNWQENIMCPTNMASHQMQNMNPGMKGNIPSNMTSGMKGNMPSNMNPSMNGNMGSNMNPGLSGNTASNTNPGMKGNMPSNMNFGMSGNMPNMNPGMSGNMASNMNPGMKGNMPSNMDPGMKGNVPSNMNFGMSGNMPSNMNFGMSGNMPSNMNFGMSGNMPNMNPGMSGNMASNMNPGMSGNMPNMNPGMSGNMASNMNPGMSGNMPPNMNPGMSGNSPLNVPASIRRGTEGTMPPNGGNMPLKTPPNLQTGMNCNIPSNMQPGMNGNMSPNMIPGMNFNMVPNMQPGMLGNMPPNMYQFWYNMQQAANMPTNLNQSYLQNMKQQHQQQELQVLKNLERQELQVLKNLERQKKKEEAIKKKAEKKAERKEKKQQKIMKKNSEQKTEKSQENVKKTDEDKKPVENKKRRERKSSGPKDRSLPYNLPKKARALISRNEENSFRENYVVAQTLKYLPVYDEIEKDIMEVLTKAFPDESIKIYKFGSRISGIGNRNSDLDLFVDIGNSFKIFEMDRSEATVKKICRISEFLTKNPKFYVSISILNARVPIVRVSHEPSGLELDIGTSNSLAYCNTKLVEYLVNLQPVACCMCIFLKKWLEQCKFNYNLNSYSMVMMVVYFLQVNNLLPPIQKLQESLSKEILVGPWIANFAEKTLKDFNLDQLSLTASNVKTWLQKFFEFYANFDFSKFVVSPYFGTPNIQINQIISMMPERYKNYAQSQADADLYVTDVVMLVHDPLQLNRNLTLRVSSHMFKVLKNYLRESAIYFRTLNERPL